MDQTPFMLEFGMMKPRAVAILWLWASFCFPLSELWGQPASCPAIIASPTVAGPSGGGTPRDARELLEKLQKCSDNIYSIRSIMNFGFMGKTYPFEFVLRHPDNFYVNAILHNSKICFDGKRLVVYQGFNNTAFVLDLGGKVEKFLLATFLSYFRPTEKGFEVSVATIERFYKPEFKGETANSYILKMTPDLNFFPFSMAAPYVQGNYIVAHLDKKSYLPIQMINFDGQGREFNRVELSSYSLNDRIPSHYFQVKIPSDTRIIGFVQLVRDQAVNIAGKQLQGLRDKASTRVQEWSDYLLKKIAPNNSPPSEPQRQEDPR